MRWVPRLPRIALSARERRTVVRGAAFLFILLAGRPAVAMVLETRTQLDTQRTLLARDRRLLINDVARARYEADIQSRLRDLEAALFDEPDGMLLASEARAYVEQIASLSAVEISVTNASEVDASPSAGLRTLEIGLEGEAELLSTLRFLRRLETGSRLLIVHTLSLEPDPDSRVMRFSASVLMFGRSP